MAEGAGGDVVGEVVGNVTGSKVRASEEGMLLAYGSLVLMALIPILVGAFRSVSHHKAQRLNYQVPTPPTPTSHHSLMSVVSGLVRRLGRSLRR
jgi:minor histocompatibility antigen H13